MMPQAIGNAASGGVMSGFVRVGYQNSSDGDCMILDNQPNMSETVMAIKEGKVFFMAIVYLMI